MSSKHHGDKIVSPDEKIVLLAHLKTTMHDLGRLPGLIFAPVIAFISTYYAKIPADRKGHLEKILDEIKAGGKEGVENLKGWLKGMLDDATKKVKEKANQKMGKSPSPKKKLDDATKKVHKVTEDITKKATGLQKKVTKVIKKKSVSGTKKVSKSTPKPKIHKAKPKA